MQTDSRALIERLSDDELDLIGVLTLVNRPIDIGRWRSLADQCGLIGLFGLTEARMVEHAASLVERGLVLEHRYGVGTQLQVPVNEALMVLEQLRAKGRLEPLYLLAKEHLQSTVRTSGWYERPALATELRVAALERDWAAVTRSAAEAEQLLESRDYGPWLLAALGPRASAELLLGSPASVRQAYLGRLFEVAYEHYLVVDEALIELALAERSKKLRLDLGRTLILRGEAERAIGVSGLGKDGSQRLALLAAFWAGDYAGAARLGNTIVASMTGRKHKALTGIEGACHVLAALAISGDDPGQLQTVEAVLDAGSAGTTLAFHELPLLGMIHVALLGDRASVTRRFSSGAHSVMSWQTLWITALHDIWLNLPAIEPAGARAQAEVQNAIEHLRAEVKLAASRGYGPIARELAATLAAFSGEATVDASPSLVSTFHAPTAWEAAIAGLDAIAEQTSPAAVAAAQGRQLVWELRVAGGSAELTPRIRESARARKGKVAPLIRLLTEDEPCLTDHDRRVLAGVETEEPSPYSRGRQRAVFLGDRALSALVGHPLVIDPSGRPLEVERRQPKLRTRRSEGKIRVELIPTELNERALLCTTSDEGRVLIYERSPALARVAEVLRGRLDVPEQGLQQLTRTLARLSINAAIEIEGELTPEADRVEADARPVLLLEWNGDILRVHARVAPLGLAGVHLLAGIGNPLVSAQLPATSGGLRMVRGRRDLLDEQRRQTEFERRCPTLMSYAEGPGYCCIAGIADALEVMVELGELGDTVILAWPQGRALNPPTPRDLSDLHTIVTSGTNWLDIDARLELEHGVVLSFRELIDARTGPRFVALGQDRFIALSERLRRQLDALQNLGTRKPGGLRTTPAMLPVLDSFEGVSFDAESIARLEQLRTINHTQPRLPRGFQAKLRDYQREGYTWIWRLAEAGLGACLADDMGLGKTIQALALLSQRASKGPALVVCPTSVVVNWTNEAARFAPNLRTTILADAADRAAVIAGAGRRDVIVCSYGVLVSETEALAAVEFATAVFDEAHALKNDGTKRARAALELQAGFRLGLTGTPIENRVEELWGLFRVLVPGLLGTKAHFDDRFAKPIARGERGRAAELRALLEHFILRRTKAQVLAELPPRTDITIHIRPNPAAQAYYEALRQRAVDTIEKGDRRKKRFRILAEISRLRQAAVDPRLLDEHAAPAGAKIDALIELILALREEGHRALVFTQFLGSMALLRAQLGAVGVEFLEIDGSTPTGERARRVEAFQAGEADVFVLSLRAGGVGINLTGADYVLHLDPWWNPAVEDQATDRAHRIGQTRPVTVYRLVSEGTIEEKILALHGSKRELADDLLAGMERADALNVDELMGLLGA